MKADPRYTPTTVWDSFPWPQAPSHERVLEIVQIVESLIALRSSYLDQGTSLARQYDSLRTPGSSKLRSLHEDLDAAVMRIYGFNKKDDTLAQLLALNHDVARDAANSRGPGAAGLEGVRQTTYRRAD
jgi:hypothetical protein